ncbi:MAG: Bax inhibitor-1/YccA family protein [Actinomycetota bacterium]
MANPALTKQFGDRGSSASLDAAATTVPVGFGEPGTDRMTIGGTARATGFLLAILLVTAAWGWTIASPTGAQPAWTIFVIIGAFVLAIVTIFKPRIAVFTAPIYTAAQGVFIGGISKAYEAAWGGIVVQAVLATAAVFIVMLVLFVTRTIKVTDKLRSTIIGATLGIALFYLVSIVLALFGVQIPFVWEGGMTGIMFSLLVVGIAAFNLLLDFDLIERGIAMNAPKHMDWYAAFSLMITIIWLYVEILRLLGKARD